MKYLVIIEGFDPTSGIGVPTNAELLQMVRQSQFADDIGGGILSDTPPDVVLYPILARFRWIKTTAGMIDGLFYYHDGSSWVLERPAPGTVDAASIADGTITLDKLSPDGDPLDIIRINAAGNGFEFLSIIDAIAAGSIGYAKLATAGGQNYLLVSNAGGVLEAKTPAYALAALIAGGTAATTFNSTADVIPFRNAADGLAYKITVADFAKELISKLTELTATAAADFVPVQDVSDSNTVKKVQIQNLLPDTGFAPGVYSNPTSVTLNSKGQVTSVSTTAGQKVRTSTSVEAVEQVLPTVAGSAGKLTVAHGLPSTPIIWGMRLKCKVIDTGFAVNDIIDYKDVLFDTGATDYNFPYLLTVDATNIYITSPVISARKVTNPSTGAYQTFTPSSWVGLIWAST